jgi:dipeptidyl aminopeptidase/acylaminoacyl peptidase
MINWMHGNWPEPFKCLVCHDGNLDERMAYYDTEELWFPEWEHGVPEWENPEAYTKHNPIDHVDKWARAHAGHPRRARTTASSTRRA